MKKINVVIAEDHPLTRETLVYQLKKLDKFRLTLSTVALLTPLN